MAHCAAVALLAAVVSLPAPARAQNISNRPIRILVPFAPGSVVDLVPRLLAERMAADLGQPVVVENKSGGLGMPAINDVLNAPADGTAILAADASHWAIAPAMQTVPYNFSRDFMPVSITFTNGLIFYTSSSSGIHSLADLIAQAKSKPGQLNFGSSGIGSVHHLAFETLKYSLGLDMKHIPYRGSAVVVESVLRGDVQVVLSSLGVVMPLVAAGKGKMLAVSIPSRLKQIPDVPTVAEITGLKDFNFPGQQGFVVKAGTPQSTIDRLGASIRKAALQPDLYAKVLETTASEMTPNTPAQFAEIIQADIKRYSNAVKVSGAKPQ
jgi:tripartite-type tricarboxylate transporter receptor subunit TctC